MRIRKCFNDFKRHYTRDIRPYKPYYFIILVECTYMKPKTRKSYTLWLFQTQGWTLQGIDRSCRRTYIRRIKSSLREPSSDGSPTLKKAKLRGEQIFNLEHDCLLSCAPNSKRCECCQSSYLPSYSNIMANRKLRNRRDKIMLLSDKVLEITTRWWNTLRKKCITTFL